MDAQNKGRGPVTGVLQVDLLLPLPSSPISHKMELVSFQPYSFQNKQLGEGGVGGMGDKPLVNPDPPVVGVVPTVSPSSEQI